MPSNLFVSLAHSQMELLAASVGKIKSMALYLPQENQKTGQLEFSPAILYPHSDRVFIANDASSGTAPSLPNTLTKLPGFAHASAVLPKYPMVYSSDEDAGVGVVEEVMCDPIRKTSTLSVPLFRGSQTVGVFMLWPNDSAEPWNQGDRDQISRAAESLSLALRMDTDRTALQQQSGYFREQLSDALHQVKNPLQALRTYAKLLQRRMAEPEVSQESTTQLLAWVEHLMVQSDRVADWLMPMDEIVNLLPPAAVSSSQLLLVLNPYQFSAGAPSSLTPTIAGNGTSGAEDFFREEPNQFSANDTEAVLEFSHDDGSVSYATTTGTGLEVAMDDESVEMVFVGDILDPIFAGYQVLAAERGIRLSVVVTDDLPGLWLSPRNLQEAVSNVLDNALKYVPLSNPDPMVSVEINALADEPGVSVVIRDNGPGIAPEDAQRVFQRGYRSQRTQNSVPGSGIGLDIAQALINRMGGELDVLPSDKGAAFEFRLYKNT